MILEPRIWLMCKWDLSHNGVGRCKVQQFFAQHHWKVLVWITTLRKHMVGDSPPSEALPHPDSRKKSEVYRDLLKATKQTCSKAKKQSQISKYPPTPTAIKTLQIPSGQSTTQTHKCTFFTKPAAGLFVMMSPCAAGHAPALQLSHHLIKRKTQSY